MVHARWTRISGQVRLQYSYNIVTGVVVVDCGFDSKLKLARRLDTRRGNDALMKVTSLPKVAESTKLQYMFCG